MLVIDTAPLVDFLSGASAAMRAIIVEAESSGTVLAISTITLAELLYILARKSGLEFARANVRDIGFQVEILPVDRHIAEMAGEFKYRHTGTGKKGVPLADALIAATAVVHRAEVVTDDPHFEKLPGVRIRRV